MGAVLGPVGYLVVSPVSTHQTLAAPHQWDNHKSVQIPPNASCGAKSPLGGNHSFRQMTSDGKPQEPPDQASSQHSAPQHMPGAGSGHSQQLPWQHGAGRSGCQWPCEPGVATGGLWPRAPGLGPDSLVCGHSLWLKSKRRPRVPPPPPPPCSCPRPRQSGALNSAGRDTLTLDTA